MKRLLSRLMNRFWNIVPHKCDKKVYTTNKNMRNLVKYLVFHCSKCGRKQDAR